MYSHDELFLEVKRYVKSYHGKDIYDADKMGDKEGYSEEEAMQLAMELVSELESAFVREQKHGHESWGGLQWGGRITYNVKKSDRGKFRIHVNFPAKYLFRGSLWSDPKFTKRTGEGINDIYALFTQGYHSSKKMPAGYWESASRYFAEIGFVKAPNNWAPNSFIRDTIEEFEIKYPGILVEYPEEWH